MLLQGYILGHTFNETARLLGRTPSGVKQKLQRMGISGLRRIRNFTPKREDGWTKEEIKILRLLLDKNPKDIKLMNQLITALSSVNLHGKIWVLSRKFEKRISPVSTISFFSFRNISYII